MKETLNILFIGDVIGDPGFNLLKSLLPSYKSKYKSDFVIVNSENISCGLGILEKDAKKLLGLDVDVLSGGNHSLDKIQTHKYLNETEKVLRPMNYPKGVYGKGYGIYEVKNSGIKICVANFQGRVYMKPLDCPFRAFDLFYDKVKEITKIIVIDFHAEVTAEKIAFGWHCDGRASAVLGTHTHIQTADNRILPGGTAYITDVGMTGPYNSVIGMNKEASLRRFIYQTPQKHTIAEDDLRFAGVFMVIDTNNGKAIKIERIFFPEF